MWHPVRNFRSIECNVWIGRVIYRSVKVVWIDQLSRNLSKNQRAESKATKTAPSHEALFPWEPLPATDQRHKVAHAAPQAIHQTVKGQVWPNRGDKARTEHARERQYGTCEEDYLWVPATTLQEVCAVLVAHPVGEDKEGVDKEDKVVAGVWRFLVEVGEHVDVDVPPEEEASQVDVQRDCTDKRQNSSPIPLFWSLCGQKVTRLKGFIFTRICC